MNHPDNLHAFHLLGKFKASKFILICRMLPTRMSVIFFAALSLFFSSTVNAQLPVGRKELQFTMQMKNRSMTEALTDLQKQKAFSWIIDGEPLLDNASLNFTDSFDNVLQRIAELYGYRSFRSKLGVMLFVKNFTNIEDRPQSNPKEISRAVEEIEKLFDIYGYQDGSVGVDFYSLLGELSAKQKQFLLRNEENRVSLNEMTERQRYFAEKSINTHALSASFTSWKRLNDLMKRFKEGRIEVSTQRVDDLSLHISNFEMAFNFVPVDKNIYPENLLFFTGQSKNYVQEGDEKSNTRNDGGGVDDNSVGSLRALMKQLSIQYAVTIDCADYLSERLLKSDLSHATLTQALDAICEMYDWKRYLKRDGSIIVQRKTLPNPKSMGELIPEIAGALPADIRDFLHTGTPDPLYPKYEEQLAKLPGVIAAKISYESRYKLKSIVQSDPSRFFTSVSLAQKIGESKRVSELPPKLAARLVFTLLSECLLQGFEVSQGVATAYQKDPGNAFIQLSGLPSHYMMTLLYIDKKTGVSGGGFSTSPGFPTPL